MNDAARASVLLAAGAAVRDCTLLAAGVLLLCAHQHDRLDGTPDRAHAWLRCLLGGALLLAAGSLLAAHTGSVYVGWWPVAAQALLGLALAPLLVPVVAIGGLAWREVTPLHAAAALGAPATLWLAWHGAPWAPCAFAALAATYALFAGLHRLGPAARDLAASHHES
jgi:hypothetical protein